MKAPKISVVIPSFNKVKYIGKTLDSIINQNYENLEIIIQDGASTDGTLSIIRKYEKKYTYIKSKSKKDNGQVDAINKGLKRAKGDILTYLNADDEYAKNAFFNVSKTYLRNRDALWFAGRGSVIDSKGYEIAKPVTMYKNFLLSLNSKFFLLIINYLMQPSVFINKKAYQKFGPFTGTEDFVTEYDLWLRLAKKQMPVIIGKTLSKFRIESSTKTKLMTGKLLKEDQKIVRKFTKSPLILFLHILNNIGRVLIDRFV